MKSLHMVAFLLVIVGALNWGLLALFGFNLVNALLGSWPTVERVVYFLVGISAVFELVMHPKMCKMCEMKS